MSIHLSICFWLASLSSVCSSFFCPFKSIGLSVYHSFSLSLVSLCYLCPFPLFLFSCTLTLLLFFLSILPSSLYPHCKFCSGLSHLPSFISFLRFSLLQPFTFSSLLIPSPPFCSISSISYSPFPSIFIGVFSTFHTVNCTGPESFSTMKAKILELLKGEIPLLHVRVGRSS